MEMRDEALRERWKKRAEQYKHGVELDIKEREDECNRKRETLACAFEEAAVNICNSCQDVQKINDGYLTVTSELDQGDAGSLNLCAFPTTTERDFDKLLQKTTIYSDMAEQLKCENRQLQIELSEKWKLFANSGETMFMKSEQEQEKL